MKRYIKLAAMMLVMSMVLILTGCDRGTDEKTRIAQDTYANRMMAAVFAGNLEGAYELTWDIEKNVFEAAFKKAARRMDGTASYRVVRCGEYEPVAFTGVESLGLYAVITDTGVFELQIAVDMDRITADNELLHCVNVFETYPSGQGFLDQEDLEKHAGIAEKEDNAGRVGRTGFHADIAAGNFDTDNEGIGLNANSYVLFGISAVVMLFVVITAVDCSRRSIKHKWVWLPIILLGAACINASPGSASIGIGLLPVSLYIRYYGGWYFRLAFPIGAVLYLCLRNKLLKESGADKDY